MDMTQLHPFIHCDMQVCIGCRLCEIACHVRDGHVGATVGCLQEPVLPRLRGVRRVNQYFPVFCNHCEDAPCVRSCRERAITKGAHAVVVDRTKCRGCPDCVATCPFQAIRLIPGGYGQEGCDAASWQVLKCDRCVDRPGGPACVTACPSKALSCVDPRQDRKLKNVAAALAAKLL
ncbi:MAG: 4Fe-4S dicluster domain-containing protein [Solidesulfovibrio sp.]